MNLFQRDSEKLLKSDLKKLGHTTDRKRAFRTLALFLGFLIGLPLIIAILVPLVASNKQTPKVSQETIHRAKSVVPRWIEGQKQYPDILVPEPEPTYKLKVLNWHWPRTRSGDYVKAEGEVKNISNRSLQNVEALVSFYDKNGNFITSGSSLIDFNPILPSQKSPFSVLEIYNPAMAKATLQFKFLMGGSILTKYK